jgi:hypothetical protein
MLFALVLPIAIWGMTVARTNRWRVAAAGVAILLYGSVLASGSRGAMLGSAVGTIVFVVVRTERLRVLVPTVVVLIAFFGATFRIAGGRPPPPANTTQAQPSPKVTVTPPAGARKTTPAQAGPTTTAHAAAAPAGFFSRFTVELSPPGGAVPIPFVPEHDEIGYPGIYEYKPILSYGSGRIYAWISAIEQGLQRPVLGYGFGTEQYVFADRFYIFDGGFTENSFVGMFLELGVVGVLLLLAPFVIVARAAVRTVRQAQGSARDFAAIGAAITASGFVVAMFQSYMYSVGNVATLTLWVGLFVTVTAAGPLGGSRPKAA